MESSKSSIGVELEFLIAVAEADQELNVPEMFEYSTGAPIVLPPGELKRGGELFNIISRRGTRTLASAIAERRGTRVVQNEEETLSNPEALHLRGYREWIFGTDLSVYLPDEQSQQRYMNDYRWCPIEISSPALWATTESWAEIREVVQAFKDEYWMITPPSAGMHYHYGNGIEYIPFVKLRRMAALLVAVDPLIAQLHPAHRKVDDYCLSNRLYSRIAHGRPAAATSRELGAEYVEAEPEFPGARPQPKPVARPFRRRTPNLIVPFRRGQLEGYNFDEMFYHFFRASGYNDDDVNDPNPRPLEIPLAVREILRCTNCPTVAELMRYGPYITDRPAYSFKAYTQHFYKQMVMHKRTVEFRQMASEMDPDAVVAHGKVVVRLCEIAAEMELEELYQIVLDCAVAEVNGDRYDVFDLLADLDLEAEAKVLQYTVARFRGETVPESIVDDQEQDEIDLTAKFD
ncbi:putative amidoligase enzyme-domain-containing protein [Xylaria castorea]|nr:putative amidoligase enzyme-domain-containing protein [Xylaria castorea]